MCVYIYNIHCVCVCVLHLQICSKMNLPCSHAGMATIFQRARLKNCLKQLIESWSHAVNYTPNPVTISRVVMSKFFAENEMLVT